MNSKQQLYFAMQRVLNDMTTRNENLKPIPFMEVAKLLAEIGQERAEPELLQATTDLCNIMLGKGKFQVQEWDAEQLVVVPDTKEEIYPPYRIKNTKESLFHSFLGYMARGCHDHTTHKEKKHGA